ncbi:hypothetical protein [Streptomyces sp. ML-6]|uniref:hypothetical protein n=1 Tax=Streptomyces sp. ML-6 TaxID=2982693 RepID=UPI0024C0D3DC|nr:hypothetical protein [Streptomyces sp. ML-6]MDK0522441.1 hypothetical protein [Streptomyces sp. ML-6]
MSARAGETFALARALADVRELLAGPVPEAGPTVAEGEPGTGEWTTTTGPGFRIVPLWEGDSLTGVHGPEWNEAVDASESHLADLAAELDREWGPRRVVPLHVPMLRRQRGVQVEPLFEALFSEDLYGDLTVWGPVVGTGRWVALGVGHSDGDAPLVLAALVSLRPVTAPDTDDG